MDVNEEAPSDQIMGPNTDPADALFKRLREIASSLIPFFAKGLNDAAFAIGEILENGAGFVDLELLLSQDSIRRIDVKLMEVYDVILQSRPERPHL